MTHKVSLFFAFLLQCKNFYKVQAAETHSGNLAFMVSLHCEQDVTVIILRESFERKRERQGE